MTVSPLPEQPPEPGAWPGWTEPPGPPTPPRQSKWSGPRNPYPVRQPRSGSPRPRSASSGWWVFPVIVAVTAGAGIAAANWASPVGVWIFIVVLGGWLVTLCLHEFGHAVTALAGGDTSVRSRGYLTLNPIRYSNAAMTFVIPLIILAIGAFPLPGGAVLIEHGRIRSPWARSAVSLAGPAVNLICGVLLAVVSSQLSSPLGFALAFLALLQFIVALLNLLPIPGLDGWGALTPFLSQKTQAAVRPFAPWAPLVLIVVLISAPQVAQPLWDAAYWVFDLAGGDTLRAGFGAQLFQFWK